jgi:hypothetical protein
MRQMSSTEARLLERSCKRRLNSHGRRAAALVLLVCIYWFFGFYPFLLDLPSPNSARYSEDGTLVFDQRGLAATNSAPGWLRQAIEQNSLRIDLEVRSFGSSQYGPAQIFTVSRDYYNRNLAVAQDGSDLHLRLRRPGSTLNGTPPFVVSGVFDDDRVHLVTLLIERTHVCLTVDGVLQVSESFSDDLFAGWSTGYRLAIGNEVIGLRPWLGEVRRATVVVDGAPIDYLGPGTVEIPADWWYIPERWRKVGGLPPLTRAVAADIFINLMGFLPLGGFLFWQFGNQLSMLHGILGAATVSLSIEFGQIYLADRYPSGIDFGLNVVGALVGWLVLAWLCRRWTHIPLPPTNDLPRDAGISAK